MSMFVIEKNIKSSEEKVVFSVIYCSLSDFVFLLLKCRYFHSSSCQVEDFEFQIWKCVELFLSLCA